MLQIDCGLLTHFFLVQRASNRALCGGEDRIEEKWGGQDGLEKRGYHMTSVASVSTFAHCNACGTLTIIGRHWQRGVGWAKQAEKGKRVVGQ